MERRDQAGRDADRTLMRRHLACQAQHAQYEKASQNRLGQFQGEQGRRRLCTADRVSQGDQGRIDGCLLRRRAPGAQEANGEPVPGQQVRRDLAVLVSAPRHVVTLQDQHGGGSDGDRQQDEPGILPALAVPHKTRLRLRAASGQQRAATLVSRNKVFVPAQAR